ncbi:YdeI/OmpD-associated family protein [Aquabacterium sp. A7-Y]|uniref:YdeI/OmpD-associated family protein n=1 Tax=Aquabacterium sp. A7-Y TaxID=1349605 RepID=UPI00223CBEFD|nr:YdeI/OmpD-associated family protein [Aquabacterium sp. A7-Y]MCW7537735.1 YdeI/OmpD-associated family protein [Aquabacterium sp. A7-Y]
MTSLPSPLRRALHPMPGFVKHALEQRDLMAAYEARPPYQRNDYLGWILRAKTDATQLKRLEQMLDELADGALYMRTKWKPATAKRR